LARKASKAVVTPLGWPTRRRPGDIVILLYHRVGPEASEIEMPLGDFERQLVHLASRERPQTLDAALAGAGGVVVTFDDGTPDFVETVVPLLQDHGIPAVLYLATGSVGRGPRSLSWESLRDAASTGLVTVGSHTHTHADLTRSTQTQAEEEMRRSKDLIEDHLGNPCRHFAYPWAVGGVAADRAVRRLFDSAALDAWRTNRVGRIDRYRLGRVPMLRSDGGFFFRRKVQGRLDSEALIYRVLGRGPWSKAGAAGKGLG
jgi:peptidoglycan/xylan/chitin deacetylase (PgdA/CDA1 family)